MNLIFSADNNWGIGYKNNLLFRAKGDMKRFRELTTGRTVIMGRKTLESLPNSKPLPNRENIVLSSDKSFIVEGSKVCHSIDGLLELVKGKTSGDLFVIGGEQLYKGLLPYCDTAYITRFFAEAEADRFMPDFDKLTGWNVVEKSEMIDEDGLKYQYLIYKHMALD